MCPRSSRTVQHFRCVNFELKTAVDADDICTWQTMFIWLQEKLKDPQFEPHAKIAKVLGSPLYICVTCTTKVFF